MFFGMVSIKSKNIRTLVRNKCIRKVITYRADVRKLDAWQKG